MTTKIDFFWRRRSTHPATVFNKSALCLNLNNRYRDRDVRNSAASRSYIRGWRIVPPHSVPPSAAPPARPDRRGRSFAKYFCMADPPTRSALRTRQVQLTLGAENIGIKVCDPLPPARGDIEVSYRHLNLRRDVVPIKLRVLVDDVGGRVVAELFVQTDFFKFVEQRICLSQVIRIAE